MSSHSTQTTAVESPTPDQMKQFWVLVGDKKIHKGNLQGFLRNTYLSPEVVAEITQAPDLKRDNPPLYWAEQAAQRYYPDAVNEILQVVAPYTLKKSPLEFRPAELAKYKGYPAFPSPLDGQTYYTNKSGLEQALPGYWNARKLVEIKIHGLGPKQLYSAPTTNFHDIGLVKFVKNMFCEQVALRVNLDANCQKGVYYVLQELDKHIQSLFSETMAYYYGLIGTRDVDVLTQSVMDALGKAVLFAAYRDSQRVKEILTFVDWQLSGNPIINISDDGQTVELLARAGGK